MSERITPEEHARRLSTDLADEIVKALRAERAFGLEIAAEHMAPGSEDRREVERMARELLDDDSEVP